MFSWLKTLRINIARAIVGGFDDAVATMEQRAADYSRALAEAAAQASREVMDAEVVGITYETELEIKALPAPAPKKTAKSRRKS